MPLLDHFQQPLKNQRPWESLHSAWANAIVVQLNESVLSPRYIAMPHTKIGGPIEIDVATWEEEVLAGSQQNGGVATAVYAPARPALILPVDFSAIDAFEIKVYEESGLKLVGAIELISPANKDRQAHREAFVRKCGTYLQNGIGLILVDLVTERLANLHAALLEELGLNLTGETSVPEIPCAAAYRSRFRKQDDQVEVWQQHLEIGQPLPTLPLWLSDVQVVPVDLERSYQAACKALRIQ